MAYHIQRCRGRAQAKTHCRAIATCTSNGWTNPTWTAQNLSTGAGQTSCSKLARLAFPVAARITTHTASLERVDHLLPVCEYSVLAQVCWQNQVHRNSGTLGTQQRVRSRARNMPVERCGNHQFTSSHLYGIQGRNCEWVHGTFHFPSSIPADSWDGPTIWHSASLPNRPAIAPRPPLLPHRHDLASKHVLELQFTPTPGAQDNARALIFLCVRCV
ncbi:hypothetical protein B0H67DRAFT_342784 [Lasiosphaeris hirsuta]|uniref:Uncharacterized protein n=1 Tax=Lasiosphaeris hirsuta TaxID=260670 RepID=A0AA40A3F5_9PEZI|nr:hypothetical protein B0H67DRAFT_342784 [Lasiosphaeris hirsuta]